MARDQAQHGVVHRVVVGVGPENVDVQVAEGEVAENDEFGLRRAACSTAASSSARNAARRLSGRATSSLCVGTSAVVSIASGSASRTRPEPLAAAGVGGDDHVVQAGRASRAAARSVERRRSRRRSRRAATTGPVLGERRGQADDGQPRGGLHQLEGVEVRGARA